MVAALPNVMLVVVVVVVVVFVDHVVCDGILLFAL